VDGGTQVFNWAPADESEVRGVIFRCLRGVTEVATSIGYGEVNVLLWLKIESGACP
jgi:hypothetical protein